MKTSRNKKAQNKKRRMIKRLKRLKDKRHIYNIKTGYAEIDHILKRYITEYIDSYHTDRATNRIANTPCLYYRKPIEGRRLHLLIHPIHYSDDTCFIRASFEYKVNSGTYGHYFNRSIRIAEGKFLFSDPSFFDSIRSFLDRAITIYWECNIPLNGSILDDCAANLMIYDINLMKIERNNNELDLAPYYKIGQDGILSAVDGNILLNNMLVSPAANINYSTLLRMIKCIKE